MNSPASSADLPDTLDGLREHSRARRTFERRRTGIPLRCLLINKEVTKNSLRVSQRLVGPGPGTIRSLWVDVRGIALAPCHLCIDGTLPRTVPALLRIVADAFKGP